MLGGMTSASSTPAPWMGRAALSPKDKAQPIAPELEAAREVTQSGNIHIKSLDSSEYYLKTVNAMNQRELCIVLQLLTSPATAARRNGLSTIMIGLRALVRFCYIFNIYFYTS